MASYLSKELIRQILLPGLHVPDVMFRDISPKSPFFRLSHQPTSVVLLVCKSWMEVATPLLYEVVILRSKAQALALERTLRTHSGLGALVRKLRVEGGLGAAMHTILTSSPHITDICLSLDLHAHDSVAGLVRSLDSINPTCLVIVDPQEIEINNAPLNKLVDKLTSTFKKWTNLNEVYVSGMEDHIDRWSEITCALSEAKNLHTVVIPYPRCTEDTIQELRRCVSLKLIRVIETEAMYEGGTSRSTQFMDYVSSSRRLRELVVFEPPPSTKPSIPNIPVLNPAYVPMARVSDEVRDSVWDRVLSFVFGLNLKSVDLSSSIHPDLSDSRILRVSKAFYRLSIPYIYGFLTFFGSRSLWEYTSSIRQNPSLGRHLRSLQVLFSYLTFRDPVQLRERLHAVIEQAPNLRKLQTVTPSSASSVFRPMFNARLPITTNTLITLAEGAGSCISSILDIEIVGSPKQILCPSILCHFRALRSLRCEVSVVFDLEVEKISRNSFPLLESLQIVDCTPSFLGVISVLALPSLREFEIKHPNKAPLITAFLKIHGPKLIKLGICPKNHLRTSVFILCPNIECLKIYSSPNTASSPHMYEFLRNWLTYFPQDDKEYLLRAAHARLTKIIIDRTEGDEFGPPAIESPEFISTLEFSNFPSLDEIQVPFLKWPATEFEISKSKWPRCSELLALQNVKLLDGEGQTWRVRLKA